jgi:hypothetical protein
LWGLSGLILALPVTAILKVIFDSVPSLEPYGFLLGEPVHEIAEEQAEQRSEEPKKDFQKKPYRRYRNKTRKKPEAGSNAPITKPRTDS